MLDPVRDALSMAGIIAMTVSDVSGFGRQKGQSEIYRGAEYHPEMMSKVKIEIALSDSLAERAAEIILETATQH